MVSLKIGGRGLTYAVVLVVSMVGLTVSAAERRPMALHVMLDGLRADAVESGQMPNLAKLRAGTWQPGYAAAWTLFARTVPESTVSAPNHVSIATGVTVAKHGVKDNGQTVTGKYSSYPTWLARVVGANPSRHALFAYSWSEDGDLGAAPGVMFLHGTDAENAVAVPARLAASDAPDATMLFIDCPDSGGHSGGYYPYSAAYLTNVRTADATIGACLAAIASRATFAEEDWLVVVVADHGGFSTSHSNAHAAQASTVPIVVSGLNVAPGEIRGRPYNYDPTANLLAHFGLGTAQAPVDARAVAGTSTAVRPFADALAVYLPFSDASMTNLAPNATVTAVPSASNATINDNGFAGKGLKIAAGGKVKLEGSEDLSFEDGGQSFTVTVWVRQNQSAFKDSKGNNTDPVIWGNKNWGSGGNAGLALVAHGARAGISSLFGPFFNYVGSARYDIGNFINEGAALWAFYAVTRTDDGVVKVYQGRRDGALCWVAENGASMTTSSSGYPFWLGTDGTGAYSRNYVGELDDFALWTRGLSHDEIRRIYENGRHGLEFGELLVTETQDHPTLAVTNYDGDTATLAIGGTRTVPYTLCVASGAADAGDDKHAWDHFDTIGEIAVATTTYAFTLPAEFKSESRKFRFFLLKTDGLPYTKELQFLQSAGSSAVDTQVYPRSGTSVELDVATTVDGGCAWFFGSYCYYNDTVKARGNFGMAFRNYTHYLHHEISGAGVNCYTAPYELNRNYHVNFSVTATTVDGVTAATGQTAAGFHEHGYPIEIFRNRKNLASYDATLKGRIGEVTLRADGTTIRDLVPVVDAEGNGAYFDQVNGRLHSEVAGTAFVLGTERDATRLGWVRAETGTLDGNATRLVTAWWTGRGTAGDFTDPANWACTNAVGAGVEGVVPMAETTVYVGGETTFAVPAGTTLFPHAGGIVFVNARLAADCDWLGLAAGEIATGSTIDLNGHVLLFAGMAVGTPNGFTVTDTSVGEPGEFRVSVAEGVTFANDAITLSGNLRLVKDGAGTFVAKVAYQDYAGGTEVVAGTFKNEVSLSDATSLGSNGSSVTVSAGCTYDLNGTSGLEKYALTLAGGTLQNSGADGARVGSFLLTADSMINFPDVGEKKNDINVAANTVWDLGGHTLTITFGGIDPDLFFRDVTNVAIRNGTVKTTGDGFFNDYIGVDAREGVTYDFAHKYRLHTNVASVMNLISSTPYNSVVSFSGSSQSAAVSLTVYGRYTPNSAYGLHILMVDGSTLDLTGKSATWSVQSTVAYSSSYKTYTTFAPDATITIDLAGRADLAQGVKVLDFASTSVPGTTTFVPDSATAENYMFERKSDGLYLAAFVKTAHWTGEAGDGDATNQANWDCRDANGNVVPDALPGLSTTAFVPADATNFNCTASQPISVGDLRFLGNTYTLSADADWSGLGAGMVSRYPEIIDVNGHELTLSVDPLSTANTDDLTTPGGTVRVYFGNSTTPHDSSANLVDNVPSNAGRILSPNPFPGCRIDYDFGAGQRRIVRGLRFYCPTTYWQRRPKDLAVYGTMADPATAAEGDWTQLGTWQDLDLVVGGWSDYLRFGNERSYRAYRLKINSNSGGWDGYGTYLELWEMELVESTPIATCITSGVAGGTLTFDVPSGKSVQIAKTSLSGSLKVRKTGAGTLVFSKENQTYSDGTEVAGGTFKCGTGATATTPLGSWGAAITVNAGGTFDLNGVKGIENYALTLAGGTLQNSGADSATVGNLVLTADSLINFPNVGTGKNDIRVVSNTEWDLGGKLLSVTFAGTDPDLLFQNVTNVTIRNGTIKTTGNGFFNDQIGLDATDRVTYDFASKLRLKANASVSNFVCRTTYNDVASRKTDNKTDVWLTLSGVFTPLSPYCYNMLLVNGATIDLSARDTAWPLECTVNYGGNYTTRTDFADGATIKIDLGEREFKEKTKIITWNKAPTNLSTLHFRSADRQYPLVADPEGVWVLPKLFMIILR